MSIPAIAWARTVTTGSPTRKAVLYALADRHNADTGRCDPSPAKIAKDTELSESSVKKALRELAADGIIQSIRRKREDGSSRTNLYRFPALDGEGATSAGGGGESEPLEGATGAPGRGRQPTPNQNLEPEVEPEGEPSTAVAVAAYDPVKGIRVEGKDLPWDALVLATDAQGDLNGARIARALKTIRPVLWKYIEESYPDRAQEALRDPVGYESMTAATITMVAARLANDMPTVTWGPEGVARNFSRGLRYIDGFRSIERTVEDVLRRAS